MNFLIKIFNKKNYGKIWKNMEKHVKNHSIKHLTMYGNKFSKIKQNNAAKV
jgi:hypothetical protein